jgi:transposase
MPVAPALVHREGIVLLTADGMPNAAIARTAGVSRPTVSGWRDRCAAGGVAALEDVPRLGRPAEISEADVVVATLADDGRPPERLGITHWSARFLAAELGTSFSSAARIWRKWKIQPHRLESFKLSTDPELVPKLRDVVGLYLDPATEPTSADDTDEHLTRPDLAASGPALPDGARHVPGLVVAAAVAPAETHSPISGTPDNQALYRIALMLPLRPGLPACRTYDYKRNGTTRLFAALEVATGKISADVCYPRHRQQEFLKFLKKVAAAHLGIELHVVLDNCGMHKHPAVRALLKDNPRISLHFTPTDCSWLNMVEIFGIITCQAIRRGTFRSVREFTAAIGAVIDTYNDRCQPFMSTKDADELLANIKPSKN